MGDIAAHGKGGAGNIIAQESGENSMVGHQNGETGCAGISQNGFNHVNGAGNKEYDVFLSHNWGVDNLNHEKVSLVNNRLKQLGYKTWFDEDDGRIKGHIDIAMSSGIEKSQVMLVFITDLYVKKASGEGENGKRDNCFKEYNHGVTRLGPDKMLPVIMEKGNNKSGSWQGYVGMHMNSRIYVDLTGNLGDGEYLDKKTKELKRRIDEIQKIPACEQKRFVSTAISDLTDSIDGSMLVTTDTGGVYGQIALPGVAIPSTRTSAPHSKSPHNSECRIGDVVNSYGIMKDLSDKLDLSDGYEGFGKILLEEIPALIASNDPDVKAELKITKLDIDNLQLVKYGGGSPAHALLSSLESRFPEKNILTLRDCALDLKRMDICKLIDGWSKITFELGDITYQERKELTSLMHKAPDNWRDLAGKLGFSMLDIEKIAGSVMLREKDSPTKKLFESIYQNYPRLKVVYLIDVAKKLGRTDVADVLEKAATTLCSGN